MAKQGNFAAFQRLQPTQGLSQDIQYWNADATRRREEKRIAENTQYDREQARKKEDQEFYDKNIKRLNNFDTGSSSRNEANGRLLMKITQEYLPLLDKIKTLHRKKNM